MATKSSKIHVYIFMVLIFFLCLLSFSVGTFVGKSVTESEMKKNQAEVYTNQDDRGIASIEDETFDDTPPPSTLENKDEEILSKEEIDALANEFKDENQVDPNLKDIVEDTKVTKEDTEPKSPIEETTERIAQGEAATEDYKKPRKPSAILPKLVGSSLDKYTVQLASYTNEKEAQKHAEKLKDKGYSAFYISAQVRGKDWFRVSVGLFDDSTKANKFRKSFVKKTNLESSIVQKITR